MQNIDTVKQMERTHRQPMILEGTVDFIIIIIITLKQTRVPSTAA